jgi:hypothetical protein
MKNTTNNMKIYKTQKEVEKDIKNGMLIINDDVKFECDISIQASINAGDITAWNITAWNITARDINARNINAWDINAWNINAGNILYDTFCSAYQSIKCVSIKADREIHHKPICLEGKLEIKEPEITNPKEIQIDGAVYRLVE